MAGVPRASVVPTVSSVPTSVRKGEAMATSVLAEPPQAVSGPTSAVIYVMQHDVMSVGGTAYKKVYRSCAVIVKVMNLNTLTPRSPSTFSIGSSSCSGCDLARSLDLYTFVTEIT